MAKRRKTTPKKDIQQYTHKDKKRLNNPPVGLVNNDTDPEVGKKTYQYDPHIDPSLQFDSQRAEVENLIEAGLEAETLEDAKKTLAELKKKQQPYLNWAGKAEKTSFEVPTVSLHVHERIDSRKIIETVEKEKPSPQLSLFEQYKKPLRQAIGFYKHEQGWTNRLVAGDSLLVMNSLLEKEGMAGKVQMIYFDPPYGIKYQSNFQPFVNKRDVKDRKDQDLTTEPEMIKAFRDTWELGIHSYLTYIRDRLLLAKELLNESGSIFMQISDENLHNLRCMLDEVFGKENFVSLITFVSTSGFPSSTLARRGDYLLWFCKNKNHIKYNQLFTDKDLSKSKSYKWLKLDDGTYRGMTSKEKSGDIEVPQNAKFYQPTSLISQGETKSPQEFIYKNKIYKPPFGQHWKTSIDGLKKLAEADRIHVAKNSIRYIRYAEDFPCKPINNLWTDTATGNFTDEKLYVVQTGTKLLSRCLLMTTDTSDLVLDITCGSGTTAYVAEQWGRRWITCDTSRIAITLTKQRLMTATFDYYQLSHPMDGISADFKYKTVPHITLKQIANSLPPETETLYDQPYIDKSKIRVASPFTVEAVPSPTVISPDAIEVEKTENIASSSIARSGETLRITELRDELEKTGIRAKGGQYLMFSTVELQSGTKYIHAIGTTQYDDRGVANISEPDVNWQTQRVFIVFGGEFTPMEQRQVEQAIDEAMMMRPKPDIMLFIAHQFDPEAAKDIDEMKWGKVQFLRAQINADLFTQDLKKKRTSNDSFWLIGSPDVELKKITRGEDKGKYQVEVLGFDYYNTKKGELQSGGKKNIAMWLLDTNYDNRSLFPSQIFFPMAGAKDGWSKLAKNLKAEIDLDKIEAFKGTVSLPFELGRYKTVAVKIIDDRGVESLKIIRL